MSNQAARTNRYLIGSLLIPAAALVAGCGTSQTRAVVQSSADIPVGSAIELVLDTVGGHISIGSGPAGNIHFDITRRAPTEAEANALAVIISAATDRVIARWTGMAGDAGDSSVPFSVTAPLSMISLQATSGGGDIDLRDRSGSLRLRTAGGQIKTLNTDGTLSLVGVAIWPKVFLYAQAHEALGDTVRARKEYQTAIPLLEAEVEKSPERLEQRALLAHAYAGAGRKEDALREARRALEIMPISKDALTGSDLEISLAGVETRVGELDPAMEHVRQLLLIPSMLSPGLFANRSDLGSAP